MPSAGTVSLPADSAGSEHAPCKGGACTAHTSNDDDDHSKAQDEATAASSPAAAGCAVETR